jgi:glycosyltransferase involved in cell wall biosynthesis
MIPNGIPIEEYPARSQANFDKRQVCYVGSLTPSKGFHLLAAAWPLVRKQIPGAKLSVIGSGKLYGKEVESGPLGVADKDYETLILQQLGTPPEGLEKLGVHFLGLQPRAEIAAILSHAAVGVINPSTSGSLECCSVASLEIQACGIPIIAGRAGGNLDTILDGKTGILVNSSPASIAAAIINLLQKEALNRTVGQNGRNFVMQHFSMEAIGNQWLSCLQQLEEQERNKLEPLNISLRNIKPWLKEIKRRILR